MSIKINSNHIKGSPMPLVFHKLPTTARNYSQIEKNILRIGSKGNGDSQFNFPYGIACDSVNRLYVADVNNHRIQCYDSMGIRLYNLGSKGKGKMQFNEPEDVCFDSKNSRILVADTDNHRIQVFDLERNFLFSFGTKGQALGKFVYPRGVCTDNAGNIYVSEYGNNRIQVFCEQGVQLVRSFGSDGKGEGQLSNPRGIALLSNGNLVIADNGNRRLSVFDPYGKFVGHLGGQGILSHPLRVFADPYDNILVTDNTPNGASVVVLSKEGQVMKRLGKDFLEKAWGVSMNMKGEILICGKSRDGDYHVFVL